MINSVASENYAQIFYQVCEENGSTQDVMYDLKTLNKLVDDEIKELILIPIFQKDKKKELIDELIKADVEKEIINLMKVLIDNSDMNLIREILMEFQKIYQEKNQIKLVDLTFAKQPSSELIDEVVKGLEKQFDKFVVPNIIIKPEIIGGVIISYDEKIINNSIQKKLTNLKKM